MAKPTSTPMTFARTNPLKMRLPSTPHSGVPPVRLPKSVAITAISAASTITQAASIRPASSLATTMRDLRGSRANVTRPLRWLDSLVTSMMIRIGRK